MNPPLTEMIDLDGGGTLSLTRFEGDSIVRVAYERAGTRLSFGLTAKDVRELNHATVAVSLAKALRP